VVEVVRKALEARLEVVVVRLLAPHCRAVVLFQAVAVVTLEEAVAATMARMHLAAVAALAISMQHLYLLEQLQLEVELPQQTVAMLIVGLLEMLEVVALEQVTTV
jgi:hypothetical protein